MNGPKRETTEAGEVGPLETTVPDLLHDNVLFLTGQVSPGIKRASHLQTHTKCIYQVHLLNFAHTTMHVSKATGRTNSKTNDHFVHNV